MKLVKAADEEVADETIEEARVVTEQDAEAVALDACPARW